MNKEQNEPMVKNTCFGKPTRTFQVNDPNNGETYTWTVCTDFFEQEQVRGYNFDKPANVQIITELNVLPFIHNEEGPAIVNNNNKYQSYWLNGLPATKEQVERLKYNKDFSTVVDEIINQE